MRYKCPKCGQTGAGEEQDILPLCHSKSCNYKVTMLPEDLSNIELRVEIVELKEWKESMLSVTLPLQEIAKELDIGLGESIHDKILPNIIRLKEENKILRKKLHDIQADDVTIQAMNLGVNTVMRWKEDAEKWKKWGHLAQQSMSEEDARVKLVKIMKGAVVSGPINGIGTITRPATIEECREAVEFLFIHYTNNHFSGDAVPLEGNKSFKIKEE